MPKNPVTDPITDQEIAFAHLILSGTMNDRRAAETVGLNPDTAAYTKAKPRVRDYMIEHRAAVEAKLVDQEAEGLRHLNLSRDQILARLWELANLSPEATRGIIAGQVKALAMIVAIEGLIPDRRHTPSPTQPTPPAPKPQIYAADWLREQQQKAEGAEPGDPVIAVETQPDPKSAPDAPFPSFDRNQASGVNPFVHPPRTSWVPDATGFRFDAVTDASGPLRLPTFSRKGPSARGR